MEVESGAKRRGGIRDGQTLQGLIGTLDQAKGGTGGGAHSNGTRRQKQACGTWRIDKRKKLAGDRRWVRATSRWTTLCVGTGGGKWGKDEGDKTTNATDGAR